MKKRLLIFVLTLLSISCFSQISTTVVKKKIEKEKVIKKYDSLLNHPKFRDLELLSGQVLYVKPIEEGYYRNSGYRGFYSDKNLKKVYNKSKGSVLDYSEYESLTGKYFNVLDVKKESSTIFVFKLQEKGNDNVVYWKGENYFLEADGDSPDRFIFQFPFITVGFYEKLKERFINQSYVIGNVSWRFWGDNIDINTGKKIEHPYGENEEWKFKDVTISEPKYILSIVLENDKSQKVLVEYSRIVGNVNRLGNKGEFPDQHVFPKEKSELYKQKFGKEDWDNILQGRVWIGMTTEMFQLSRGNPDKVNKRVGGRTSFQQWIYENEYFYFLNGKLSSWTD